jgi:hypothetical protein
VQATEEEMETVDETETASSSTMVFVSLVSIVRGAVGRVVGGVCGSRTTLDEELPDVP